MLEEFKKFAMRGNVVDLAVGVIIGGAFGKIVDSLVNDVIMPVVGRFTGKIDFAQKFIELTDIRGPCHQLRKWDEDLPELIVGRSGWVAKVVSEGMVKTGDEVVVQ